MPQTRLFADLLGVATICLVAVLLLLGLFCIGYSCYLRSLINGQGLVQLRFFTGPCIIRTTFVFLTMWWGICEILRWSLLRHKGRVLGATSLQWQENVCKFYLISNLGFTEPYLFLTLIFLLRASLQSPGTLSQKWNKKTACFIFIYCLPMFVLQLTVILLGPKYKKEYNPNFPSYFFKAATPANDIISCTYPLLSTFIFGLFTTMLTAYLLWLGSRILHLVINRALHQRVYALIVSISSLFPLRVVLLGLSILPDPGNPVFDAVVFLAFIAILFIMGISVCILVYLPIADSLSLRHMQQIDVEASGDEGHHDSSSLLANQNSVPSAKRGSISFSTMNNSDSESGLVELNLLRLSTPGSPRFARWAMNGDGGDGAVRGHGDGAG